MQFTNISPVRMFILSAPRSRMRCCDNAVKTILCRVREQPLNPCLQKLAWLAAASMHGNFLGSPNSCAIPRGCNAQPCSVEKQQESIISITYTTKMLSLRQGRCSSYCYREGSTKIQRTWLQGVSASGTFCR